MNHFIITPPPQKKKPVKSISYTEALHRTADNLYYGGSCKSMFSCLKSVIPAPDYNFRGVNSSWNPPFDKLRDDVSW
jgi:hypothetical protein